MSDTSLFTKFSHHVSHAAGRPQTFALACAGIVLWAVSGPLFGFSETWQLVVNTVTTIITFLMVFVVQNTQNRDGEAIQAKLDELIRASQSDDTFIGAERLSEKELHQLREMCVEHAARKAAAE
jgi:low affinity Fe/Cu permease